MRDALSDIVKQASALFPVVRVIGSETETLIKGEDGNMIRFFEGKLKEPLADLSGEFGMANMELLSGLLNFASYKSMDATVAVKRRDYNDTTTVEQIEFRNPKTRSKADYRVMNPEAAPSVTIIGRIPWDVSVEIKKEKVTEFNQLYNMYSEFHTTVDIRTDEEGNLHFILGDDSSSTHRASMVFAEGVEGKLRGDIQWDVKMILEYLKQAGNHLATFNVTDRGVISVQVETPYGDYSYVMRANA
jgi:hypothetical protein